MDIYAEITKLIIDELEKGVCPWTKPWASVNQPVSHTNGRPYSVLNQLMLSVQMIGENNMGNEYLTFNQCKKEGGSIKKGEKSSTVVFWSQYKIPQTEEQIAKGEEPITIPLLKYYKVFEVGQCEGIKRKYEDKSNSYPTNTIDEAERVTSAYFAREACSLRVIPSNSAYYRPSTDEVVVPQISQFKVAGEYYSTLFHEMTHSTGHESRLNRLTKDAAFGNEVYSKEELVAELGSCFLSQQIGISCENTFRNSTAYLQSWLNQLKNDKKLIVFAASKAEAAVKYILNGKENK